MGRHEDVSMIAADWQGVKHRKAKVERCKVGYLVTYSVVVDVPAVEILSGGATKRLADERVALATRQEVHEFLDRYFS